MASDVSGVMDDLDGLWVTTNGKKWMRMDVSKDSHSALSMWNLFQ